MGNLLEMNPIFNFYPCIKPSGPYLTIWQKKRIDIAYSFWDLLYGAFDPWKKENFLKNISPHHM